MWYHTLWYSNKIFTYPNRAVSTTICTKQIMKLTFFSFDFLIVGLSPKEVLSSWSDTCCTLLIDYKNNITIKLVMLLLIIGLLLVTQWYYKFKQWLTIRLSVSIYRKCSDFGGIVEVFTHCSFNSSCPLIVVVSYYIKWHSQGGYQPIFSSV